LTRRHTSTRRQRSNEAGGFCVSPLWLVGLFVFAFAGRTAVFVTAALSALVHEGGHAAALLLLGRRIDSFALSPSGMQIKAGGRFLSYKGDIAVSLAGPAASFMLALLGTLVTRGGAPGVGGYITGINFALCLINLLPALPLDGGRALWSAMAMAFEPDVCDCALRVTSWVCAATLFLLGIAVLLRSGYNFSLIALSLALMTMQRGRYVQTA